jgi:hypothetical protein
MKVVATKVGFDGKVLRQPGDAFEMPDGAKGSWFKPAPKEKTEQPARAPKGADELV